MTKLNTEPIKKVGIFYPPLDLNTWSECYYKNQPYSKVLELLNNEYMLSIIKTIYSQIKHVKKYQWVDVKVQKLTVGQNTANGLWHLDSSLNPIHEYENYLFVSGKALTEFSQIVNSKVLEKITIPANTIIKFNGKNVHRGVEVKEDETRLLIRLVNTDQKLPSSIKYS